jgi:hypothetical protein
MQPISLPQFVLDTLLKPSSGNPINLIRHKLFRWLRSVLINRSDPLVRFQVASVDLLMPLSHELPFHIAMHPQYSLNVGRIAGQVFSKHPNLRFIDIGANIGDTVAILRQNDEFPILCIEGDKRFFEILAKNIAGLDGIYLE